MPFLQLSRHTALVCSTHGGPPAWGTENTLTTHQYSNEVRGFCLTVSQTLHEVSQPKRALACGAIQATATPYVVRRKALDFLELEQLTQCRCEFGRTLICQCQQESVSVSVSVSVSASIYPSWSMEQGDIVHTLHLAHIPTQAADTPTTVGSLKIIVASVQAACKIMHGVEHFRVGNLRLSCSQMRVAAVGPSNDRSLRTGDRRISVGRSVGMCGHSGRRQASECDISQIVCRNDDCVLPHTHTRVVYRVLCIPLALSEWGQYWISTLGRSRRQVGNMLLTGLRLSQLRTDVPLELTACTLDPSNSPSRLEICRSRGRKGWNPEAKRQETRDKRQETRDKRPDSAVTGYDL